MDIIKFYNDFGIDGKTEGHKHCRPGWINIPCPFCIGNSGRHLGYSLTKNYFRCWRCGYKNTLQVIQKLTKLEKSAAISIMQQYGGFSKTPIAKSIKVKRKGFKYPSGLIELQPHHKRYIEKRGFDPDYIASEYNVLATGPISKLDKIDYSYRLFIPIEFNNEIVSFTTRDYTNKTDLRYISCPKEREKIEHKTILYGIDKCKRDEVIVVEGPTDVWRMGNDSAATFGIEWKLKQVKLIASRFKKCIILYDDDPQAIKQADVLAAELSFRGIKVIVETIVGDPGSMAQDDANHLKKELLKKIY